MAVSTSDIVTVNIPQDHVEFVVRRAEMATIGGRSNVYSRKRERRANLKQDQFVSQSAQYALSVWLTGGIDAWRSKRMVQEADPKKGNGGQQLMNSNVVVRSSRLKAGLDPLSYRLAVRPEERYPDTVYVLAVVDYAFDEENDRLPQNVRVRLMGWIREIDLPAAVETGGPFRGAFLVGSKTLNPLPPFVWGVREGSEVTVAEYEQARAAFGSAESLAKLRNVPGVKMNVAVTDESLARGDEEAREDIRSQSAFSDPLAEFYASFTKGAANGSIGPSATPPARGGVIEALNREVAGGDGGATGSLVLDTPKPIAYGDSQPDRAKQSIVISGLGGKPEDIKVEIKTS